MAKSQKKKVKTKSENAEYVDCLLELHKLQLVMLNQLKKTMQKENAK